MTDFDMLVLSLIINVGLIIHNSMQAAFNRKTMLILLKCTEAISYVADGKAEFYREGSQVRIKGKKDAKDQLSAPTV